MIFQKALFEGRGKDQKGGNHYRYMYYIGTEWSVSCIFSQGLRYQYNFETEFYIQL